MAETTPRFGLPLLEAGQAQKEVFHNEAVSALETLAQAVVETAGDNAPPAAPAPGRSWIVGPAPTGDWAGAAGALATWTAGGWRFTSPIEGMSAWVTAASLPVRYATGSWVAGELRAERLLVEGVQVVGARQPAVMAPAGGTVVDAEGRDAIGAILAALRIHGLIAA